MTQNIHRQAFQTGLDVYKNLQAQAKRNVGNAKVLYEELRKRFPRTGRSSKKKDDESLDE
ncbi:MAG: hypothetical protein LBF61_03235 [Azoarcus sp.]|nr:hypothetical protein [Azoarcus sp.]